MQLIECVPNFSEGRDLAIIKQITDEIARVDGVRLLDVDAGSATNRTVVTFVGTPQAVIDAAYAAIKKAGELIDLSTHTGEHPRMGATDVCPLIPISGITMEETAIWARRLAQRVGEEQQLAVYCYEAAAFTPERENLATIRAGEYEGFFAKIQRAEWRPDFGPAVNDVRRGATVIGARDFLIAYNVNLNTTSERRANAVAFDVREQGRIVRDGDSITGKPVLDEHGEPKRIAGTCKAVKGIGWYIAEYGIAQVSMNITNIRLTQLHEAFEACVASAAARGMRVTGSELVGLVPLSVLLDAGRYYLARQERSTGVSDAELIKIAVRSMGLDELSAFDPQKKVIEYLLAETQPRPLVAMNLRAFADETASESPAPGGGSIAAYVGALGVSLATMVANLSAHKRGWDARWHEFSVWAAEGQALQAQLLNLVDDDTASFNRIMDAFKLPKGTAAEKEARTASIQAATLYAIQVPQRTMQLSLQSFTLIEAMIHTGNPNSITDAGVAALCARAAVHGAFLNVKINAKDLTDKDFVNKVLAEGAAACAAADAAEARLMAAVHRAIA